MVHMKKVFAILLAAMISLSIAACGKKDPAVFAPVSTAPQQVMRGETMVGVLYPGSYSMPNSYSASHHEEILYAARLRLRDYETQLLAAENVATDRESVENAVDELVAWGANMIIGTDVGYSPYMLEIAEEHPNVIFLQMGGRENNGKNLVSYFSEIYKSYFAAGYVAGLQSLYEENDAIGFVSAYGMENPDAVASVNAFWLGARRVNVNATVYLKVLENPEDWAEEENAASALVMEHGCGVLAQYTNTAATLAAARYLGVYACGPYFDAEAVAPDTVLVSPRFSFQSFFNTAFRTAEDCTYSTEFAEKLGMEQYYGIFNAEKDLSRTEEEMKQIRHEQAGVLADVLYAAVSELGHSAPTDPADPKHDEEYGMRNEGVFSDRREEPWDLDALLTVGDANSWRVWEEELRDSEGNVVFPIGGKTLTTDEIRSMNYYLEGVVLVTAGQ